MSILISCANSNGISQTKRKCTQMKWKYCWWKTNLNLTKMTNKPHQKKTNRHETPVLDHPIKIIYVDNDLVVLDKPCSLPVSRIPQTQKAPTRITKKNLKYNSPWPSQKWQKNLPSQRMLTSQPTDNKSRSSSKHTSFAAVAKKNPKTRNQTRSSWKMWKFNMKHEPNIWMTFHVCCKQWDLLLLLLPNRAHPQTLLQFALCASFFLAKCKDNKRERTYSILCGTRSLKRNWTFFLTFPSLTCRLTRIVSMHLSMLV